MRRFLLTPLWLSDTPERREAGRPGNQSTAGEEVWSRACGGQARVRTQGTGSPLLILLLVCREGTVSPACRGACVLRHGVFRRAWDSRSFAGPWPLQSQSTYEGSKMLPESGRPSQKAILSAPGVGELDAHNVTSCLQSLEPATLSALRRLGPGFAVCKPRGSSGPSSESQSGCKVLSHTWREKTGLTTKEGTLKKAAGENAGFSSSGGSSFPSGRTGAFAAGGLLSSRPTHTAVWEFHLQGGCAGAALRCELVGPTVA